MRWTSGLLQRKRKNPTDNKNECFGKSKIISFLLLSRGARRGLTQSPAESVFYQCGDKNKIWLDLAPHGHRLCHMGLVVGGTYYVLHQKNRYVGQGVQSRMKMIFQQSECDVIRGQLPVECREFK